MSLGTIYVNSSFRIHSFRMSRRQGNLRFDVSFHDREQGPVVLASSTHNYFTFIRNTLIIMLYMCQHSWELIRKKIPKNPHLTRPQNTIVYFFCLKSWTNMEFNKKFQLWREIGRPYTSTLPYIRPTLVPHGSLLLNVLIPPPTLAAKPKAAILHLSGDFLEVWLLFRGHWPPNNDVT